MFVYMIELWGGCKKFKGTCAIIVFVYNEITTKLTNRRHITERYVVLPHKYLRNACASLQGDVQLTSACQMFGISSAIEGVQQISILSSIAEQ